MNQISPALVNLLKFMPITLRALMAAFPLHFFLTFTLTLCTSSPTIDLYKKYIILDIIFESSIRETQKPSGLSRISRLIKLILLRRYLHFFQNGILIFR